MPRGGGLRGYYRLPIVLPQSLRRGCPYSLGRLRYQLTLPKCRIVIITRNTSITEPREARGRPIKCQGWEGGENWSKLRDWGGQVSTVALILKGEMYF